MSRTKGTLNALATIGPSGPSVATSTYSGSSAMIRPMFAQPTGSSPMNDSQVSGISHSRGRSSGRSAKVVIIRSMGAG